MRCGRPPDTSTPQVPDRLDSRPRGYGPATFAAAVVASVLLAVAGMFAALRSAPAGPDLNADGTGLQTMPPPSSATSGYASTLLIDPDTPTAVSGPPLTEAGRPEVLYVATEYCPYCAEENWALIVALSRFGQFTGLTISRSPQFEDVPPIGTWTFYGSYYTSP